MKMILVMGPIEAKSQELLERLKALKYSCIEANQADEIDQLGKHMGKVAVIFLDHKHSFRFLQENQFHGYDLFNILFVTKKPIVTPEVQSKLNSVSLNLYSPGSQNKLIEDLEEFFSGNKKDPTMDIEFIVPADIEGE